MIKPSPTHDIPSGCTVPGEDADVSGSIACEPQLASLHRYYKNETSLEKN